MEKRIAELEAENKRLADRLDKALEFIRDCGEDTYSDAFRWMEACRLLKEIDVEKREQYSDDEKTADALRAGRMVDWK